MFKKLKDKLAEEVKSSPQRIQLFAQAAQAAVTSASSSISDITNSDLFSIGDNDSQNQQLHAGLAPTPSKQNVFQDVSLSQSMLDTSTESMDYAANHNIIENQRQRRLSNSSFASDVSFRLPNYESPSMYHLQSDMEISASEAEERGLSGGSVSLDRVTKEQLYAVFRRTQERYAKYRSQYGDLARHYKLLERENAKARSVLVETQDKALRRISELKEQCTLEQSAKAHLEKALRIEIEEQAMKIETLNTRIKLLQENYKKPNASIVENKETATEKESYEQLIDLSADDSKKQPEFETSTTELTNLTNKVEKMEQLLTKYKDSLKASKDKNAQLTAEIQILSNELDNKKKENDDLGAINVQLTEAKQKIQELNETNEDLQNKINSFDFAKSKEMSVLEIELQKAQNEISDLRGKIEVFTKREEEYAISLAENKLTIHKELESKEKEIKALKNSLSSSQKELQSLSIIVTDYKKSITSLEEEKCKLNNEISELLSAKTTITQLESQLQELSLKCTSLEQSKTKLDEEHRCLQLQMKQETAEKLAIIDRNDYLSNRNTQLIEETEKKSTQISTLENKLQAITKKESLSVVESDTERNKMLEEIETWKTKCKSLESEINDEKVELVKLQSDIEKLLANHDSLQTKALQSEEIISKLKLENSKLQQNILNYETIKTKCYDLRSKVKEMKNQFNLINQEINVFKTDINEIIYTAKTQIKTQLENILKHYEKLNADYHISRKRLKENRDKDLINSEKLRLLEEENKALQSNLLENISDNNSYDEKINNLKTNYESNLIEMQTLKTENEISMKRIEDLEKECNNLQEKLSIDTEEYQILVDKLSSAEFENQNLIMEVKNIEGEKILLLSELDAAKIESKRIEESLQSKLVHTISENNLLAHEINEVNKKIESNLVEIEKLKTENNISLKRIEDLEIECNSSQDKIRNYAEQHQTVINKMTSLKIENQTMIAKINDLEGEKSLLISTLNNTKIEYEKTQENLSKLIKEYTELANKTTEIDDLKRDVTTLEEKVEIFEKENMSLTAEAVTLTDRTTILEAEVKQLRELEAELKLEKNKLASSLEQLMQQKSEENNEKIMQQKTEELNEKNNNAKQINNFIREEKTDMSNRNNKSEEIKELRNVTSESNTEIERESVSKIEFDLLKEENKRLNSDIEGLQTYLRKISKENSHLNDKLRELIASSENAPEKTEGLTENLADLKNEVQSTKEKLEHLSRENAFLLEENLELKDQLNAQNYNPNIPKMGDVKENEALHTLKAEYDNLYASKKDLHHKLNDLETMNSSVNRNMQQMQEKNEKLKLSNEKLATRLDEALVSLRHIHSLQENTELEYLKNILYEYLTGSGTHSLTLAKVLSAIVKFDEMQTQLVLQKEKERQGLLRQLGLM